MTKGSVELYRSGRGRRTGHASLFAWAWTGGFGEKSARRTNRKERRCQWTWAAAWRDMVGSRREDVHDGAGLDVGTKIEDGPLVLLACL